VGATKRNVNWEGRPLEPYADGEVGEGPTTPEYISERPAVSYEIDRGGGLGGLKA
jgi:hypothetical protein